MMDMAELQAKQARTTALVIAVDRVAHAGAYYAEPESGAPLHWHLIETFAGAERKAAHFLRERGFGVWVPEFNALSRDYLRRVRLADQRPLIFPGHALVATADVLAHWRRITGCPGVRRIACDDRAQPVVVAAPMIERLRALEWVFALAELHAKRPRAGWRRHRRSAATVDDAFRALDGAARNQALRRALGLSS